MKFTYTAKSQRGELQTGVVEAGSRGTALATLQGYGLVVLRLQEEVLAPWYLGFLAGFRRVSMRELSIFTRQLATLVEAQVPLIDALRTMFQQANNVYLKEAVFDIVSDVEAGAALSQALAKHESIFSSFYIQMTRSAEITGRLQEVFIYLADYYESQAMMTSRIKSAMIYPAFVFGLFAIVVAVMILFVIPSLQIVFAESGVEFSQLPFATRVLFGLSSFFKSYGWVSLIVFVIGIWALRAYFRSPEGRVLIGSWMLSFPIVGDLARKVYVSRFAETVSVMISGDIPIAQALEVASGVVGNPEYEEVIRETADAVRRGELISEALALYPKEFPSLITQMMAVGERTGRIDELLGRVAKFYNREIDRSLENLTELIQPILIVILGVFVGMLIGAIILPIYQLAQNF